MHTWQSPLARSLAAVALAAGMAGVTAAPGQLSAQGSAPGGWVGLSVELQQTWQAGAPPPAPTMVVSAVHPGSPAAGAGLQPGDTIVRLNELAALPEALARLQSALQPGRSVSLTIRKAGQLQEVTLQAASRPDNDLLARLSPQVRVQMDSAQLVFRRHLDSAGRVSQAGGETQEVVLVRRVPGDSAAPTSGPTFVFRFDGTATPPAAPSPLEGLLVRPPAERPSPVQEIRRLASEATAARTALAELRGRFPEPSPRPAPAEHQRPLAPYILGQDWVAGARLTPLNPGLAEYFGAARGVLVLDVAEGTPAAAAGVTPGDVILRAGDDQVASLDELRKAFVGAGTAPGALPLVLIRRGQRLQVTLRR